MSKILRTIGKTICDVFTWLLVILITVITYVVCTLYAIIGGVLLSITGKIRKTNDLTNGFIDSFKMIMDRLM